MYDSSYRIKESTLDFFSGNSICTGREAATGIIKDIGQVEREGPLHVKFTVLDGKVMIYILCIYRFTDCDICNQVHLITSFSTFY